MHWDHPVLKDDQNELAVPGVWRGTLKRVVDAFVCGDVDCARSIRNVCPMLAPDAQRMLTNIKAYGDELAPLPEAAWETSIYRWSTGCWEVLVDLFTTNQGASDLVMFVRVYEHSDGFKFEIDDIHVP